MAANREIAARFRSTGQWLDWPINSQRQITGFRPKVTIDRVIDYTNFRTRSLAAGGG